MRFLTPVALLLVLASSAGAQSVGTGCAPVKAGAVNVETVSDGTIRGTLFCLSPEEVAVMQGGQLVRTPLSQVRQIRKPADPVWDGAVKGAAIVLTVWGVGCKFCGADTVYPWRAVAGYALLGTTIDALNPHRTTIYTGGPRPSLTWHVRF
jgi:hypothetical protein